MEWHNNLSTDPCHPVNFDGHGNCEDPVSTTYSSTDPDYDCNETSYIGGKPAANAPPPFDVQNYDDPKTKQYIYWYHTKLDEQSPALLIDTHVAKFYGLELKVLDDEHK